MIRRLVFAVVVVASITIARGPALALSVQEAILRAKPAVVLVVAEVSAEVRLNCGDGERRINPPPFRETGTGWVIDPDGMVITNGHVVQPAYAPPRWLVTSLVRKAAETACVTGELAQMGLTPDQRPDLEEQIRRRIFDTVVPRAQTSVAPRVYVMLGSGARHPAEVRKYSPPVAGGKMSGRDLALLKIDAGDLPVLPLADSSMARIGDSVRILGFPGVVLSHELLNRSAAVEASVTNGAISGFQTDVAGHGVIQTDASAAWGNSGGPAIDPSGHVLGVLTFVSLSPGSEGAIVQGFNFIIPSAAVREFVGDTPVRLDAASTFNQLWWRGLAEFFAENYRGAARTFAAADQVQPNLPDVKQLLTEARERPTPIPWAPIAIGVTLVSLGVVAILGFRHWRRNRFRIGPADVVKLLEGGAAPPLLVDVRSASAYAKSPLKIPNALRLTPDDLKAGTSAIDVEPTRTVVAYCT
jgi:Trypsin-like peptidase domain